MQEMGAAILVCILGTMEGEMNIGNWEFWLGNPLLPFSTCQYWSSKLLPKPVD